MDVSLISTVFSPENSSDWQLLLNTINLNFLGFFGHEKTFDSFFFPTQASEKMSWKIEFFISFFPKNKNIPPRNMLGLCTERDFETKTWTRSQLNIFQATGMDKEWGGTMCGKKECEFSKVNQQGRSWCCWVSSSATPCSASACLSWNNEFLGAEPVLSWVLGKCLTHLVPGCSHK